MTVKGNHPLAEILARKLFGIEAVPPQESMRMCSRAAKSAIEYHNEQLKAAVNETKQKCVEAVIAFAKKEFKGTENAVLTDLVKAIMGAEEC